MFKVVEIYVVRDIVINMTCIEVHDLAWSLLLLFGFEKTFTWLMNSSPSQLKLCTTESSSWACCNYGLLFSLNYNFGPGTIHQISLCGYLFVSVWSLKDYQCVMFVLRPWRHNFSLQVILTHVTSLKFVHVNKKTHPTRI